MPLYEYQCEACGRRFEVIQKFSDPPVEACRSCGAGPVQRLLSSPAIQFKGTGWYITDYSQKGKPPSEAAAGEKGDKGSSGDKKDTKEAASGSEKETKSTSSSDSASSGGDSGAKPPASSGTGT